MADETPDVSCVVAADRLGVQSRRLADALREANAECALCGADDHKAVDCPFAKREYVHDYSMGPHPIDLATARRDERDALSLSAERAAP